MFILRQDIDSFDVKKFDFILTEVTSKFIEYLKERHKIDLKDNDASDIDSVKANIEDSYFMLEIILKDNENITYESKNWKEVDDIKYFLINEVFDNNCNYNIYFMEYDYGNLDKCCIEEKDSVFEYNTKYGHIHVEDIIIKDVKLLKY